MLGCLFRMFLLAVAAGAVLLLFEFRLDDGELRVKARFGGSEAASTVKRETKSAGKAAARAVEEAPVEEYPEESRQKLEELIEEETE